MTLLQRKPFDGPTRRLVLAFDIGTTFSGISYCILQPGEVPQPQGVMRYPGQGRVGDCKVPSVMYYDSKGYLQKVGYEALKDEVAETALARGWVKLEWWKLHLRPKHLSSVHIKDSDIPPLPKNKSIIDVLKDFIKYLFRCAEAYIQDSYPTYIWLSVKDDIQFIFTHPNGWEGAQQQQIRRGIELAGLVPSTLEGRARIQFLTEGKHPKGQGIVVIDAGGGTLDLSMYSMNLSPVSFKEIAPGECHLQGSVFVTQRARGLLQRKLAGSRYSGPDMIDDITSMFDQTTKLHVSNAKQPAYIRVGGLRENDPGHNIKSGKVRLSGEEVTKLFDESIATVIRAFEQQRRNVNVPITMAFLVGGFGASDWLWSQLDEYFKAEGIKLSRPSRVHKAVPDGALSSFILDHLVKTRVTRATYGISGVTTADNHDAEHLRRSKTWFVDDTGRFVVPKKFHQLLRKGVQVNEQQEFRNTLYFTRSSPSFDEAMVTILCYRGTSLDPHWTDSEDESFRTLCVIHFDVREAAKTLKPKQRVDGAGTYYDLEFEVIIFFGITEFRVQVAWEENGIERRSPAEIIYDDN